LRYAQLDPPLLKPFGERLQLTGVRVGVGVLESCAATGADHTSSRGRRSGRRCRVMMMVVMVVMRVAVRAGTRVRVVVMVAAHHACTVDAGVERTVTGPVRHRRQRGHGRR